MGPANLLLRRALWPRVPDCPVESVRDVGDNYDRVNLSKKYYKGFPLTRKQYSALPSFIWTALSSC
jgi:hypothetical protein